ncbi:MAG: aldehyde dehydrogenase [Armatimonadetes bacterium]|nr:aldehyde dehydrogenase [Armatimonadota bacterium]
MAAQTLSLLPEVRAFLSEAPLKSFVGGEWVASASGECLSTLDPGTGEALARFYALSEPDVDRAVAAADAAFRSGVWSRMPANERGVLLHRLADAVERHIEVLTQLEALDCGKLAAQAEGDIRNFIATLRYFTDLSVHAPLRSAIPVAHYEAHTVWQPWGPCGFIFPWNFPILLLGWGTAPALAAGNTVVVKPAEDTPLSTLYMGNLVREAGIPDGVFNAVAGLGETAGAALARHPGLKRLSFTGSPEVGRLVAEAAGRNLTPVKLELGGKGAAVIFEDVDLEETASKLVGAITFHTGQVCCDATRWIIQDRIYDEFVERCRTKMEAVKIGLPLSPDAEMGPVVSDKQRRRVLGYLERGAAEGARTVLEGGACSVTGGEGGFYVKPALLAGDLDNVAAREEIFGPVAYLARFGSEAAGVAMANHTAYGLANSVWTADLARARRVAEGMVAGNSWINCHNVFPLGVPYGGANLSGMGGGVNSPQTLWDYYRPQSVVRPL